jgi:hypothetical protein
MTDVNGQLRTIQDASHPRLQQICYVAHEVSVIKARYSDTDAKLQHINEAPDDKTLLAGLHRNVQISEMNMSFLNVTVRKGTVDVPTLARNLGISLESASRTRGDHSKGGEIYDISKFEPAKEHERSSYKISSFEHDFVY